MRPLQRQLMAFARLRLFLALVLLVGPLAAQDFPNEPILPPLPRPAPAPEPVAPPLPVEVAGATDQADPANPAASIDRATAAEGSADAAAIFGQSPRNPPSSLPAPVPEQPVGAGLGALRPAQDPNDSSIGAAPGSAPAADPGMAGAPGAGMPGTETTDAAAATATTGEGAEPAPAPSGPGTEPGSGLAPGIAAETGVDPTLHPLPSPDQMGPPRPDPEANAFGASPISLLGTKVLPGSRERLRWTTGQSFSGSVMETPVIVIHGERPGPRLCLTAGVHGDELNGVETVRRLAYGIEPDDLAGTVIAVPIVNLLGFSRGSRYLPDRRDLNRFFPGSANGSSASRIAHSFFAAVIENCDALVDFHTGSFDRANLPQVRADLRNSGVVEFTRGFGATAVLHSPGSAGMLRIAASRQGIPAVTFEIGAPLRLQPEEIEHGVQAIQSLMHQMNMVATRRRWTEPQAVFYESRWIRVDQGGMLFSELTLGDRVERGDLLGRVIDPVSNRSTEVRAPEAGRVIGMALNQLVLPGFAAYHLGVASSEEQVVIDAVQESGPQDALFLEQLDGTSGGGPAEPEDPAEATSDEAADSAVVDELEDG